LNWLFFQFFLHIYFLSSVLGSLVYGSKGWKQSLFDSVKFAFFYRLRFIFSPHESVLPSGFDRAYRLRLYQSLICLLSFPYLCFLFLPSYSSPMISLSAFPSLSQYVFILKDRRGDQRGGEWEPIKFLLENLVYVPTSIRTRSLLTRLRPPSYRQAIGLWNWARNCDRDTQRC
jgi:hypothetical protein